MSTIAALFNDTANAERAINELLARGIAREALTIQARDQRLQEALVTVRDQGANVTASDRHMPFPPMMGALGGMVLGACVGLLIGIGAVTIPGMGRVPADGVAATVIGAALLGAGLGAALGAVVGVFVAFRSSLSATPETTRDIDGGGVLIAANVDDSLTAEVQSAFQMTEAVQIDTHRDIYQQGETPYMSAPNQQVSEISYRQAPATLGSDSADLYDDPDQRARRQGPFSPQDQLAQEELGTTPPRSATPYLPGAESGAPHHSPGPAPEQASDPYRQPAIDPFESPTTDPRSNAGP